MPPCRNNCGGWTADGSASQGFTECRVCKEERAREIDLVQQAFRSVLQRTWMMNLAHNLAVAGGLCRAFQQGVYAAASWTSGQLDGQNAWEPGCARPA